MADDFETDAQTEVTPVNNSDLTQETPVPEVSSQLRVTTRDTAVPMDPLVQRTPSANVVMSHLFAVDGAAETHTNDAADTAADTETHAAYAADTYRAAGTVPVSSGPSPIGWAIALVILAAILGLGGGAIWANAIGPTSPQAPVAPSPAATASSAPPKGSPRPTRTESASPSAPKSASASTSASPPASASASASAATSAAVAPISQLTR